MKTNFSSFDFFLLRTPCLPSKVIQKMNGFKSKEKAWNYMIELLQNPQILDAIYIASRSLFNEFLSNCESSYSPLKDKLLFSLIKYVNRMAGRSTPYGKFAGISLGKLVNSKWKIELSGSFYPFYRLDMEYLDQIVDIALKKKNVIQNTKYFTNSTLNETVDRFYFIDYTKKDGERNYGWAWVSKNILLKQVLLYSENGIEFSQLLLYIQEYGVDQERAIAYIYKLSKLKLLINEFEVGLINNKTENITSRLKNFDLQTTPHNLLASLEDVLEELKHRPNEVKVFNKNEGYCFGQTQHKNLLQSDLRIGTLSNSISNTIVKSLAKELEELSVLNRAKSSKQLKTFCRKFKERYGEREIPLLEAIDEGRGIGYSSVSTANHNPLLNGLGITKPIYEGKSDHSKFVQSTIERFILVGKKITSPIELDHKELQSLESKDKECDLPFAFYAIGNLLYSGHGSESDDYHFNILAAGGTSAIPLMTRFSHLDTKLEDNLQKCANWEEERAHDSIIAEIICLPNAKAGNILTRPSFFKYEIPIIGQCKVQNEYTIKLDDLLVSVIHGKVILRSKRLGKRIIPRLSSAHNFHYQMVVYRFLCDVQNQTGNLNLSWDWGELETAPFTPRITYKHIILARAKWFVAHKSLDFSKMTDNHEKIIFLRRKHSLPPIVSLSSGDNELVIDFRSPISAEIILKELRKGDVVLHEYLLKSYNSPVTGVNGEQYNNEIIIPFKVESEKEKVQLKPMAESKIKRSFHPGSEWAYYKVYCNVMEGERLLKHQIKLLCDDLKDRDIIEKWFFIRYFDPDPHIRLRFLLKKKKNGELPLQQFSNCINRHFDHALQTKLIYRLVYDTYERELERYGMDKIEVFESIFHIDSESTIRLLPLFNQEHGKHLRWLTAMLGIDNLLTVSGLNISQKTLLVTTSRDTFFDEFEAFKKLKYKLDKRYRENRSCIESFFTEEYEKTTFIHKLLKDRIKLVAQIIESVSGKQVERLQYLNTLPSLIHMYINRFFLDNQRENEMVIYHFLTKFYTSCQIRNKTKTNIRSECH